jgi:hypothetical protein
MNNFPKRPKSSPAVRAAIAARMAAPGYVSPVRRADEPRPEAVPEVTEFFQILAMNGVYGEVTDRAGNLVAEFWDVGMDQDD